MVAALVVNPGGAPGPSSNNWNVREISADGPVAFGEGLFSIPPGPGPYFIDLPLITAADLGKRILFQVAPSFPPFSLVPAVGVDQSPVVVVGALSSNPYPVVDGSIVLVAQEFTGAGPPVLYLWVAETAQPVAATSDDVSNQSAVVGGSVTDALDALLALPQPGRLINVAQLAFGASPYVVPAGITQLIVELVAGGGGGAGYDGGGAFPGVGAGGGGGGYVRARYAAVVPGTPIPYVIGLGGAGGVGLAAGLAGGLTEFGAPGPDQIRANGGGGGGVMVADALNRIATGGVFGFAEPIGPAIVAIDGQQGGNGRRLAGAPVQWEAGRGGLSALGAGGFGGTNTAATGGTSSTGLGGGGGGGESGGGGGAVNGGGGRGGGIIVYEYS